MFKFQDGKCAICKSEDIGSNAPKHNHFCVDHNHETGEIRGLLCFPCNRCIGQMKDDPERLRSAADYVERYN